MFRKSMLKADATNWLLEEENPSARYFTLKDILDKPEHNAEVQQAKREIMQYGIILIFFGNNWNLRILKPIPKFYTDKYRGLVWQLIVLAEMGAEANSQIIEQCEYLLNNSQETEDGGFAMNTAKKGGGRITELSHALRMVWSLIHFCYLDDPGYKKGYPLDYPLHAL